MPTLSIVILNYNTQDYLTQCLQSIYSSTINKSDYEIVVVDNNSTDHSVENAKQISLSNTQFLELKTNKGFSYGNNQGLKLTSPNSKYVLFLNPDTIVSPDTLKKCLNYFATNPKVDALTCKVILAKTGQIQPECHRGFPTPWRAFCYFSNLYKLAPKSKLLNGYFLGNLDLSTPHPIEACVGAFIMLKRTVGQKINWWDDRFFFYGEDLDLCYQLHKNNFLLYYFPEAQIVHYQGIASGLKDHSKTISTANSETKKKIAQASTSAMRIFYDKNYKSHYSTIAYFFISTGISLLEIIRLWKAKK